jgi:hypothetical protein
VFITTNTGYLARLFVVGSLVIAWGWALMSLGRRGYLPFPEAEG